jgi:hypothetical protein
MKEKSDKSCACCGEVAGEWVQWPNQDTGTGLCQRCVDWIQGRGTYSDEEFVQIYGQAGVHYPFPTRYEQNVLQTVSDFISLKEKPMKTMSILSYLLGEEYMDPQPDPISRIRLIAIKYDVDHIRAEHAVDLIRNVLKEAA